MGRWLPALLIILCASTSGRAEPPRRIVSINVCTDQLLILLTDRSQIAAVTHFAARRFYSNWPERARGIPTTRGEAEAVLRLKPDLVLAGPFSPAHTIALLRRLKFRVEVIPIANSLEEIRRNIRRVGTLIHRQAEAADVIRRFDARLESAAADVPGDARRRPTLALYWLGGYSSGSATLVGDIARAAGFRNLADSAGVSAVGALALEQLVAGKPDALVLGVTAQDAPSLARDVLHHPALRRLTATLPSIIIESRRWVCGTPAAANAVERLSALRRRVGRR